MNRTSRLLAVVLLPLAASGCVARSQLDAVKKEADTCQQDKATAQKTAADCQSRLEGESKRWDGIEAQLTSTLPQTLRDFQDERAKIIQLLPEEVKKQVAVRLDRHFVNMSRSFERMDGKVQELQGALDAARKQIAELATTTQSVDTRVQATHEAVVSGQHWIDRFDEQTRRSADIAASVLDFDRLRINCESCDDRIKLKGDGREHLLAFHQGLVKRLQAPVSAPAPAATPSDGAH